MTTFDVQIWEIKKFADAGGRQRSRPYRLRWRVGRREFSATYRTKALADSERAHLISAARRGEAFDEDTGRPLAVVQTKDSLTWYQHAREYVAMKWPAAAANTRRSMVEALTPLTVALVQPRRGTPNADVLRRAIFRYGLNPRRWNIEIPEDDHAALEWLGKASLPLISLAEPQTIRAALTVCATKLDGTPAAATTVARKRAVLYNALGYAVELRRLAANPIDGVQWRAPAVAEAIDRRVVANPSQVLAILDEVRKLGPHGERLVAFYGCLYYTGARPAEVTYLMRHDCELPAEGWGRVTYVETEPLSGSHWTDDGRPREVRGLKHRARKATRPVPAPPELVALLREHIEKYGVGKDGRVFVSVRGNPVSDSSYDRIWKQARAQALTPEQVASPLARRPYDLRHACASLWLNAGVSPTRAAQRLGHSVAVLLRVYANCIHGDEELMNERIANALR